LSRSAWTTAPGAYPGTREPPLQRLLFSRRLAYLAAGLAVLLVFGLLGWWVLEGRYTTVPKVIGVSVATAQADLRNVGLTPGTTKTTLGRPLNRLTSTAISAGSPPGVGQKPGGVETAERPHPARKATTSSGSYQVLPANARQARRPACPRRAPSGRLQNQPKKVA